MAHQRKLIRAAVIARLKAAGTAAGQRVFGNRARPIFPNELPAILVYTKNEPVEQSAETPREYRRNLVVALELVAKADSEEALDDVLDDLAEQVEQAIFSEETFGGLATDTLLGETEMELLAEGEKPIGAAKISLTMPYFQQIPGDLTGSLDPFERMNTEIDVTGDGEPEIESRQELPQV